MVTTTETQPRRERIEARVTAEIKSTIERAAAISGLSVTDFVVQSARERAELVIQTNSVIKLSARDSAVFAEALLNPPEPNAELLAAMKRYREIDGSLP